MVALVDFAAKVRWRKRFDHNPRHSKIQDKLAVKDYAANFGIYSAKVFYRTKNPETIPFDQLPDNCFIKANHGCSWNILCLNRKFYYFKNGTSIIDESGSISANSLHGQLISTSKVKSLCKKWLSKKYNSSEWAYQQIDPWIYVEEIIAQADGSEVFDYRFYTFNGKEACLSIG